MKREAHPFSIPSACKPCLDHLKDSPNKSNILEYINDNETWHRNTMYIKQSSVRPSLRRLLTPWCCLHIHSWFALQDGTTAFDVARQKGYDDVVELLLHHAGWEGNAVWWTICGIGASAEELWFCLQGSHTAIRHVGICIGFRPWSVESVYNWESENGENSGGRQTESYKIFAQSKIISHCTNAE